MEFNKYQYYAPNSNSNEESEVFLEKLKLLKTFKTEKEVRAYLKDNWGIKDDIENFGICSNIRISAGVGKKYYNVTFEYTHDGNVDIKSFNYIKEERSIAW